MSGTAKAHAGAVLELCGVTAGYGRTTVLRDVTLAVAPGSVTALLGPNGAGKTTLLHTAAGVIRPRAGRVVIAGRDMTRSSSHQRAHAGLCLVPEGRGIFRTLTVRENLRLQVPPWAKERSVEQALEVFPILRKRLGQPAGRMSGGQQQMLALARAFLSGATIVLLDEVSMGLAPIVVEQIFASLDRLRAEGVALLLVEQYVTLALGMADQVHLLGQGRVVFSGTAGELDEDAVVHGYLGADISSPDADHADADRTAAGSADAAATDDADADAANV